MNFCFPYCFVNLCHLPEGRLNLSASFGKLDCDFYRESDFPNLERKSCGHTFKTLVGFFLLPFKRFRFLFCDSVPQNRNTNIRIYLELTKKNNWENIKADMRLKCVKGKEYIYMIGKWDEYLKYLENEIKEM